MWLRTLWQPQETPSQPPPSPEDPGFPAPECGEQHGGQPSRTRLAWAPLLCTLVLTRQRLCHRAPGGGPGDRCAAPRKSRAPCHVLGTHSARDAIICGMRRGRLGTAGHNPRGPSGHLCLAPRPLSPLPAMLWEAARGETCPQHFVPLDCDTAARQLCPSAGSVFSQSPENRFFEECSLLCSLGRRVLFLSPSLGGGPWRLRRLGLAQHRQSSSLTAILRRVLGPECTPGTSRGAAQADHAGDARLDCGCCAACILRPTFKEAQERPSDGRGQASVEGLRWRPRVRSGEGSQRERLSRGCRFTAYFLLSK